MRYIASKPEGALRPRAECNMSPYPCIPSACDITNLYPEAGGTKSRNGEMRNEKLEMRKWKRKWKWSSLLLVDNTEVDAIVYGVSKGRYRSLVVTMK